LHGAISADCSLQATADGKEQSSLVAERVHPSELRQPPFGPPVVRRRLEQFPFVVGEHRARIRAQVLDAVVGEPALDFAERVPVLLRMLILIAQPRLAPGRFALAIPKDRIEWNPPEARRGTRANAL
jgi:hypothetical protein